MSFASTNGTLWDTGKGYPALTQEYSTKPCHGELYSFDSNDVWDTLDNIEGATGNDDSLYQRKIIHIRHHGKGQQYAWAYVMNNVTGAWISDGYWQHDAYDKFFMTYGKTIC